MLSKKNEKLIKDRNLCFKNVCGVTKEFSSSLRFRHLKAKDPISVSFTNFLTTGERNIGKYIKYFYSERTFV